MTRLALLFAMLPGIALAHEWYPNECCSSADCIAIRADQVTPEHKGWRIKATGEVMPYSTTRMSPDGQFHRCSPFFGDSTRADTTLCLFAPQELF